MQTFNDMNKSFKNTLAKANNTVNNTVHSGVSFVKDLEKKSIGLVKGIIPDQKTKNSQISKQVIPEFIVPKIDPILEKQVLAPIPTEYFDVEKENFDAVRFWLQNMPDKKDDTYFMNESMKYEKALGVVQSKLTYTVITNYTKMVSGMAKVHEVGLDLDSTTFSCRGGRNKIKSASENMVKGSFLIISRYRKRKNLARLEYFSNKIWEIRKREAIINGLVQDGNFPEALKLMLDLNTFMASFQNLKCISNMNKKSDETYAFIKSKVDDSLAYVLNNFDGARYEKILIGCQLLGNLQISTKIVNYYKKTIDKILQQITIPFISVGKSEDSLYRNSFDDICKDIQKEDLLPITLQSLSVLSDVIYNYHQMWIWHTKFVGDKYDATKLFVSNYRKSLWEVIQNKLSCLLTNAKFAVGLESFLQIYHAMDMFCDLAEEFTGSDANGLRGALKGRAKQYFLSFHRSKIEDVRIMMEQERYTKVAANFLDEMDCDLSHEEKYNEHRKLIKTFLNGDIRQNFFRKAADHNKFPLGIAVLDGKKKSSGDDDSDDSDSSSSSSSSSSEDEEREDVKPVIKQKNNQHIYTSSSLKMMQIFERYFFSMQIMKHLSTEIFYWFGTLYASFIYNLHSIVGNITNEPLYPESDTSISEQLKLSYKLLRENLNKTQREITKEEGDTYPLCRSVMTSSLTKAPLYGLLERVIAVETITMVLSSIKNLCTDINKLLPRNKEKLVPELVSEMDSTSNEVKELIILRSVSLMFSVSHLPKSIVEVQWDSPNMETVQVNKYMESLINNFKEYGKKISPVMKEATKNTAEKFWTIPIMATMDNLVEGYSRIKKCDVMGRNIMKFDLSNLEQSLKNYSPLETIPKIAIVRSYIEGYHYGPEQIWDWIQANFVNYTKAQIESLIIIGAGQKMQKPKLKELLAKLEKLEDLKKQKQLMLSPREKQSIDLTRPSLDSQRPSIVTNKGGLFKGMAEYFGY